MKSLNTTGLLSILDLMVLGLREATRWSCPEGGFPLSLWCGPCENQKFIWQGVPLQNMECYWHPLHPSHLRTGLLQPMSKPWGTDTLPGFNWVTPYSFSPPEKSGEGTGRNSCRAEKYHCHGALNCVVTVNLEFSVTWSWNWFAAYLGSLTFCYITVSFLHFMQEYK